MTSSKFVGKRKVHCENRQLEKEWMERFKIPSTRLEVRRQVCHGPHTVQLVRTAGLHSPVQCSCGFRLLTLTSKLIKRAETAKQFIQQDLASVFLLFFFLQFACGQKAAKTHRTKPKH